MKSDANLKKLECPTGPVRSVHFVQLVFAFYLLCATTGQHFFLRENIKSEDFVVLLLFYPFASIDDRYLIDFVTK